VSPEFKAAYDAAIAGKAPPKARGKFNAKILGWLVERYRVTQCLDGKAGARPIYTRKANRAKLSTRAADKLLSERDANIYSLTCDKVRE
jgi:hypothetical protein